VTRDGSQIDSRGSRRAMGAASNSSRGWPGRTAGHAPPQDCWLTLNKGGSRSVSWSVRLRRRIAVSMRAMDRSAVFIVPIMNRFCGSVNSLSGEYCKLMEESRYSRQEVQLAEHLGQVRSVDLVDDQDVSRGRVRRGHLREVAERPGPQREGQAAVAAGGGPEPLEEVLVRVRRVELDELDRPVFGQVPGETGGQVGLARARRPVEDDLLALREQVPDLRRAGRRRR
jgi:hypothetical protein